MIISLTKQNFSNVIESAQKPVIIDVFAIWCGPCIQMKPHFEKLAEELGAHYTFATLNIDEARDLAMHFGITSVPTLLFIKNNRIVGREVGYMPKEELRARITEYLG